ncbi:hypothetical protein [Emticicia sp. TH156]|uniref:hypothetical protein n=1 Tax=Emticicia sp. TH156 TaxID=2067454 RepID=UPI000C761BA4|nr:hypothetical protein [Emticicia sp. TH156]PLK46054.1 hypothetical protein C0V77_01500 [Emticicia sp. TH156]
MEKENENYYNTDFQHGYITGVENVDKATYESYLSSHVSFEWLQGRINDKREELTRIDHAIAENRDKRKASFDKLQEHLQAIDTQTQHIGYINKDIDANHAKIASIEVKHKKSESPYSLFAGILYLLAGVAFVSGDLIISHEIVAYALNIRNNFEAWAFAIGLAMLSVLLKPAYERLVEHPYLHNYNEKTKKVYGVFQGFLLVFSIGTMLVLGWFRYEAYKTDKLKEGINKQIKAMQLNSTPLDPSAVQPANNQALIQKMDEQLKAYDKLNIDLVNSPWALMSFVLSGILFAIAGAICLGIALPVMHAYWYRWLQSGPAIRRLRKQNVKLTDTLKEAEKALAAQIAQKNVLENDLITLPEVAELKEEKKAVLAEIDSMLEHAKLADQDRRINSFNDGVAKGTANRSEMTDDEYEEFRSSSVRQMRNAQDSKSDAGPKVYRNNGLRPHQALRKVITEQFNQNQNPN